MSYRIIPHPLIADDLFEITDYVASYAGLAVGKAKVDEILRRIDKLKDYPHIGTLRNKKTGLRVIPASKHALVCFKVDESAKTVSIITITYAGADWQARVKDRL
jgi:plasmid stabilization system protein ParE